MANTYTLISSVTVGSGGAASIDFTSIPATYTDLVIKVSARSDYASVNDAVAMKLNGSTANMTTKQLYGTGSAAGSGSDTINKAGYSAGANDTSNVFGNVEFYIPNYASSNYKSSSGDGVNEYNGTGAFLELNANLWSNTAAITSISLYSPNGGGSVKFVQYTTAYLYGISNA